MDIHSIDHLELYVADAEEAANQLCQHFGFTVHGRGSPEAEAADFRSILLRQHEITLVVTQALRDNHRAWNYVQRHGDGVAVIAVAVDDAHTAFTEAVKRGAAPIEPPVDLEKNGTRTTFAAVNAFGDVVHRFVSRSSPRGRFAPGVIEETEPAPGRDGMFTQIDHLAVCLPAGTLAETVRHYQEVFGFAQIFEEQIVVGTQAMDSKVVQNAAGTVTLTIIEPDTTREPGQIDEFVRAHDGAGVQHVAFLTDDIARAVRACSRRDVRFLTTPPSYYDALPSRLGEVGVPVETLRALNVLADRDFGGVMLQIFTASRHPRRTLFYELIDRRGARTFGSNNIKALYEAVERQRAASQAQT